MVVIDSEKELHKIWYPLDIKTQHIRNRRELPHLITNIKNLQLTSFNRSVLKEINPKYSLEGLMLKPKLQHFGHLMQRLTHWKRPWCQERLRTGREGGKRGWDSWMAHQNNGQEFEQTLGDGERQGSLVCCSPWDLKELDMTELLYNNNLG